FVAESPKARRRFALRGPFGAGVAVYAALADTRAAPRLYASSCNAFFGMKVLRSTNLGKAFKETKSAPAFPKEDGRVLANIWSLAAGDNKKDLWCGVEPASLVRSGDGGDSWELVPGISNHEHARKGQPGARAVWRSEDGGGSWRRLAKALPKKQSFFTVQRDAMDIDELKSPALYFGTTTGQLWIGRDGGEEWECLYDSLPPIHNVKVAVA